MSSADYDQIRASLNAAAASRHPKGAVSKLSYEFEDAYLTDEVVPQGAFDLFKEIFSDQRLSALPGLSSFIAAFFTDFEKLSKQQRDELLDVFANGAGHYSDELTRHAIGDLVARKYSPEQAVRFFKNLIAGGGAYQKQIALTGADILMKRVDPNAPLYEEIDSIWSDAQNV